MQKVKIFTECGDEIIVEVNTNQKIIGYEEIPLPMYRMVGNKAHWTLKVESPYHIIHESSASSFSIYDENGKRIAKLWDEDVPAKYQKLYE